MPWTLQDADRIYQIYETEMRPKLAHLPSYYFRRQCYTAFMTDDVGLHLAKQFDFADNLVWSADYPHGESTFGESRNEVKKIFDVLGDEAGKNVVGGTAARLWNI